MELAQYSKDVIPSLKHIDRGHALFWYNQDKVSGYRVTARAYQILVDRGYSNWDFELSNNLNSAALVLMDKKIQSPYYIHNLSLRRVTFFERELASAMALTGNDINNAVSLVYC